MPLTEPPNRFIPEIAPSGNLTPNFFRWLKDDIIMLQKEASLQEILQNLDPVIAPETYVYVGVSNQSLLKILGFDPVAFFKEPEGITLILKKEDADNNLLGYQSEFCRIILNAPYTMLCAGLTAIVSSALAKAGISVIPILTAYKRSIFVEKEDAQTALEILNALQNKVQGLGAH